MVASSDYSSQHPSLTLSCGSELVCREQALHEIHRSPVFSISIGNALLIFGAGLKVVLMWVSP
ncbi:Hypothetical predicted protein, partial [Marmota monax]